MELNSNNPVTHGDAFDVTPTPSTPQNGQSFSHITGVSVGTTPNYFPGQVKALDGISLRAFLLGCVLGVSSIASIILLIQGYQTWRASFFLATLCLFHFLEYYTTAAYNTKYANVSAFLITNNGYAYNLAHTGALIECLITSIFFPDWQAGISNPARIMCGLFMIFAGQMTRSIAMAQAGTNFNHNVQTQKDKDHVLVQHGIYAYLRHPSYFGFFWWGLGTQIVLGNTVCLAAYAVVLWKFFSHRIKIEEDYLIKFFGKEYEDYRRRSWVGIPLIK